MMIVKEYTSKKKQSVLTLNLLFSLQLHIGYLPRRWNTYMNSFINFKSKNLYLLDIIKALANLKLSLFFVTNVIYNRGKIVLVDKRLECRRFSFFFFKLTKQFIFTFRWVGGILTNFHEFFVKQKPFKKKYYIGDFWLERKRGKFLKMTRLPDTALIFGGYANKLALIEILSLGIPLISIISSDMNPSAISFIVPGNDSNCYISFYITALYMEAIFMGYLYERKIFYALLRRLYYLRFLSKKVYVS